jgi:histidine ammonia-lyase
VVASHADCGRVQDPYTLRCAPQVIGAVDDALGYVAAALERELEAVTDNPLVFPAQDDGGGPGEVLAGGNFHGQPLSLPLDHLALALCELASFSERRVYALLSPAGSIPTSAGTEDFNSMGALAALKAREVVERAAHVIAIELVCACQGLEFHRPLRTTAPLERAVEQVRGLVPRLEEDRSLATELAALATALRTGSLSFATEEVAL